MIGFTSWGDEVDLLVARAAQVETHVHVAKHGADGEVHSHSKLLEMEQRLTDLRDDLDTVKQYRELVRSCIESNPLGVMKLCDSIVYYQRARQRLRYCHLAHLLVIGRHLVVTRLNAIAGTSFVAWN